MKRAKLIEDADFKKVVSFIENTSKNPLRDTAAVALTVKAGLRAAEVAKLRWEHVTQADGTISDIIELSADITKGNKERSLPMNRQLKKILIDLRNKYPNDENVIRLQFRTKNPGHAMVMWFSRLYAKVGLQHCSSHSGRRTFITKLARNLSKHSKTLVDVQKMVGHSDLKTTERYIEPDTNLQRLVNSI